jgi:hypothetical protein
MRKINIIKDREKGREGERYWERIFLALWYIQPDTEPPPPPHTDTNILPVLSHLCLQIHLYLRIFEERFSGYCRVLLRFFGQVHLKFGSLREKSSVEVPNFKMCAHL